MRTAVVTGAARGLGRAIAARLTADGFAVWAVDTDEAEVTKTAAEIGATACALDVTDEGAVAALAARLERCDALVNNAAIWRYTPLATTPAGRGQPGAGRQRDRPAAAHAAAGPGDGPG